MQDETAFEVGSYAETVSKLTASCATWGHLGTRIRGVRGHDLYDVPVP
jgi:hypothetical protein